MKLAVLPLAQSRQMERSMRQVRFGVGIGIGVDIDSDGDTDPEVSHISQGKATRGQ
jgi:hypothetical protein